MNLKISLVILLKISIGTNIKEGPWGGGNLFAINLKNYLTSMGHEVFHDLKQNDLDIILITEPRRTSESSAFTDLDVRKYLSFVNKNCIVVHRINECDERKQTNYVNKYIINANKTADETIFVSKWLKNLYVNQGIKSKNINVIMAGADIDIFNSHEKKIWDKKTKLKLVTHHWGANWNKGFDTYENIDKMLDLDKWKNNIEFTYIGNIPKNFRFKNTKIVEPLSGDRLSDEIKENHIYVTGSLNEPSGNHHIEGAQCGLPVLYLDSGGTPEYCEGFGLKFNNQNFELKLKEMMDNYDYYENKMADYPFSATKMSFDYLDLFKRVLNEKENIINSRVSGLYLDNIFSKTFYNLIRKKEGKK